MPGERNQLILGRSPARGHLHYKPKVWGSSAETKNKKQKTKPKIEETRPGGLLTVLAFSSCGKVREKRHDLCSNYNNKSISASPNKWHVKWTGNRGRGKVLPATLRQMGRIMELGSGDLGIGIGIGIGSEGSRGKQAGSRRNAALPVGSVSRVSRPYSCFCSSSFSSSSSSSWFLIHLLSQQNSNRKPTTKLLAAMANSCPLVRLSGCPPVR